MNETANNIFACEHCGRSFRWSPQLAGKRLKCPCGQFLSVPASLPTPGENLPEFAPATQPTAHRVQPIEYQQPSTRSSQINELFPDRVKDFYMPLALIAAGVAIHLAHELIFGSVNSLAITGRNLILSMAISFAAILLAGRIRKISFGPWPVAAMKLSALLIGGSGAAILIRPLFFPLLMIPVSFGVGAVLVMLASTVPELIVYFVLLGTLFDLDESDTWYCLCWMFVFNTAGYFALNSLM
jgi:hypothetical protein